MNYKHKPLHISTPVPNGTYEVTVTVTAHEDITFTILAQSRRFMAQDVTLKKGCAEDITFNVSVCDYHKNNEDFTAVKGVDIYIMCDGDFSAVSAVSPAEIPTIYIAGDSTVTDQPAEYPYTPASTYCGWGQMLPQFLNTGIAVENHAQSGSTTEDFKNVNFTAFKDKIKAGDFLIVEFGHNDQKIESLDAFGGYTENLKYFIDFAREKGAVPIISSPINRIIFKKDGTLMNLLGDYRNAVKRVCGEMDVAFIDLWSRTTEFFEAAGAVKAWDYFWGNGTDRDYTHTNDIGGNIIARFAADEIIKNDVRPIADLIKRDMIGVEMPERDDSAAPCNAKELEHIKTIGLVNIPDLADIDKDITDI
ncbi:MAG: rhamnogalacturonan acetylesterase [Firmicutes bacterium]|nr:rhamnogalacturonan acetylesterase [Bacillota bacterium]